MEGANEITPEFYLFTLEPKCRFFLVDVVVFLFEMSQLDRSLEGYVGPNPVSVTVSDSVYSCDPQYISLK